MANTSHNVQQSKPNRPFIQGARMRCPRCKRLHAPEEYTPLREIDEFKEHTTPIMKCPSCGWLFAPVTRYTDLGEVA